MTLHFDLAPIRSRFGPRFNESPLGAAPENLECALEDDRGQGGGAVPDRIQKLIAQRSAVSTAQQHQTIPAAGQIVRIPAPVDHLQADDPNEHLAVLLDAPVSQEKWSCFVVTRDPQYATYWDLVLGPEEEDRDPQCQLVQVWNRTTVNPSRADKILCQLSAPRMAAIQSLAKDFVNRPQQSMEGDSRPGVLLARELSDGTGVVTGTHVQMDGDPRTEYGALYRNAAVWVARQTAPEASVAPSVKPREAVSGTGTRIHDQLRDFFAAAAGWRFVPALATVVIGVLVVLNMSVEKEPPSPSGGQPTPVFKYISAGSIQELKAKDPELLVKEMADRFIAIGGFPETRKSGSQMFSLYIATGGLEREKLLAVLGEYRLNLPEDSTLRVDVIQEADR